MMLLLFIPIGITVDLAEKIGKILKNDAPLDAVLGYYLDFTVHFAYLLFPLFLFLSVIWFTSKLANNTEIVAFLSSGVSFSRFLRPYLIGATIVAIITLFLGMYLAPVASKGFNEFVYKYLKRGKVAVETTNIHKQLSENDFIYVSRIDIDGNYGKNFTWEHIENNQIKYKILADEIRYNPEDSTYKLKVYRKRTFLKDKEILETAKEKDTTFAFTIDDLTPTTYAAETKPYGELVEFIEKEKMSGSSNIGRYEVVKLKKWSLPVSIFILTIIAVAVSSVKRRGGMGLNLAIGISIALVYVFFDKVFGVLAAQANFSPIIAVWLPNLIFGILAFYLLQNAKR